MTNKPSLRVLALVGALGLTTGASLSTHAQSGERIVNCRVESNGTPAVRGKCRFVAGGGGSFVLESVDTRRSLTGPIQHVSVQVVSTDVAEVRGLTKDGINSRWGQARRARDDRSCWVGSDFRVCAW